MQGRDIKELDNGMPRYGVADPSYGDRSGMSEVNVTPDFVADVCCTPVPKGFHDAMRTTGRSQMLDVISQPIRVQLGHE